MSAGGASTSGAGAGVGVLPGPRGGRGPSSARGGLGGGGGGLAAALVGSLPPYLRRAFKWRQMDIEYTLFQMRLLLWTPKKVYASAFYNKQTKNQWARDDPSFVLLTAAAVAGAGMLWVLCFGRSSGVWHSLAMILSAVLVDFLGVGAALATGGWALANRHLRVKPSPSESESAASFGVEQHVEWLFAFDIHCNAFVPLFGLLYVVQLLLSPLLLMHGFLPAVLANSLYAVAFAQYHYITFLGYSALPFLERTEVFLYPVGVTALAFIVACLSGFNASHFVIRSVYFG